MIEGFSFDLTSAEVREKIEALIAHRNGRIVVIEREIALVTGRPLEDFQERIDRHLEEDHGQSSFESAPKPRAERFRDSVLRSLKLSVKGHKSAISRLEFMRDHLVKNETFRVDWVELGHLFPDSRDHGLPICFGHDHDEDADDGLNYFGPPQTSAHEGCDE